MANVKGGIISHAVTTTAPTANALGVMIGQKSVKDRFEKMLGKKSNAFLSSLLTLTNQNRQLQVCEPKSILSSAAVAASLDLPINPTLGLAWIVPYKGRASFQIGYKGLIQLAQRSGMMRTIIATEVYEGEIRDFNRFTETYTVGEKVSDEIVGYFASFETVNGFKKSALWTKDEVVKHAKRFSKAYGSGPWQTDFDAMAKKTVLANILNVYAPKSTEMQQATEFDGKDTTLGDDGNVETIDTEALSDDRVVDVETGEILEVAPKDDEVIVPFDE